MIKNVLITGGAGYIGSHIAELLVREKKNIFLFDNLSTGHKKLINKKAKFFLGDIRNKSIIKKIIINNNIDSIIHLAAVLSVGESERKPAKYKSINFNGTKVLLSSIKDTTVKNFLFSSTCAVYKDGLSKVTEKSLLKPTSVYGKSKLLSEKYISKFCKEKKLNFGILRFFNVVGASPSGKIGQINKGDQLFKNLSSELKKKNPVFQIYGDTYKTKDGTCIRDYIHVNDIANIHLKVLNKIDQIKKSTILNCGYAKGISVLEVMREFRQNSKKNIKLKILGKRRGDMAKITADTSKLRKFLNWYPKYNNLNKIVKSCIKWENNYK